jgi:hypothetical protein
MEISEGNVIRGVREATKPSSSILLHAKMVQVKSMGSNHITTDDDDAHF